jgi:hypothetical protein
LEKTFMPKLGNIPQRSPVSITKADLLAKLLDVDHNGEATSRVLALETDFRRRIHTHLASLPTNDAHFSKFNTNPFVLMIHSRQKSYRHISQIESDILPAKVFSSMETSAGRMVEAVVLPIYGWNVVPSAMHTSNSVLDGRRKVGKTLCLATLKSGPRCLNDEMSENIADAILHNCRQWAESEGVKKIDFTYGVLYGTKNQSNKKDWHILRNIKEKLKGGTLLSDPTGQWACKFQNKGVSVTVTIRIGIELWNYIGGSNTTFLEMCSGIIRACISPANTQPADYKFSIADLPEIISLDSVPSNFNVSLLQRSQLEWLFFFARHFCDELHES